MIWKVNSSRTAADNMKVYDEYLEADERFVHAPQAFLFWHKHVFCHGHRSHQLSNSWRHLKFNQYVSLQILFTQLITVGIFLWKVGIL